MTDQLLKQVQETLREQGVKASAIAAALGLTPGVVRHALCTLEKRKLAERTRPRGRNLLWGPPGTAARHREQVQAAQVAYEAKRAGKKREQRALDRLYREGGDPLPACRRTVPASTVAPLVKTGPNSVWELGA